ncbi:MULTISPECIES: winged helix-turn-helix transcriptional regulator [Paenibacillus]|nr:winged helix-turn-helix transcriptional regulator [Paenibacillus sp. M-152]MEE4569879.1 winged helix-turn-helix transcriptional regulator [Paenibacillus polymyxa]
MRRFNELRKSLLTITHRTLTRQLREHEEDDFMSRVVFAEVPPKVEL